jgi:hypothetical protein
MRHVFTGLLSLIVTVGLVASAGAAVVINEILANPGSQYDGAEFIELYNNGATAVNIGGWRLTGTEFEGTCTGEDHWEFPAGTTIPAGGYIVVAKDNRDHPSQEDDAFFQRFGFNASFELYDASEAVATGGYEYDDPAVPNMILNTASSYDDQIGFIPGNGYGASCNDIYNRYEALYLYDGLPPAANVIDVIEYRDADDCDSDACGGIGSGDNDAFEPWPGVGESLGRDASSTDTNNSAADLHLGTCTPFAANLANAGPLLDNMGIDNPDPYVGESVTVSIEATDADGMGPVYLVYTVESNAPDSLLMTYLGNDIYRGTLPVQTDTLNVRYFVRARDAGTAAGVGVSKYPDYWYRSVRWGTQTINQVQFFTPPSDTGQSGQVGRAVNVEGIVTAEPNLYSAGTFTIQSGPGLWNGVHCYNYVGDTQVQRGDSVRVSGVVGEYYDLTQVQLFGNQNVQVLASGKPLPGPEVITCDKIVTGALVAEPREGTYARLENVQVTLDDDGYGQWEVTDATGTALIGNDAFYYYSPAIGDSIDAIEGIVAWTYSERKLEPRDNYDVQGPPVVHTVRYSPLPPTAASAITFTAQVIDNGTITRAKLYYSTTGGAPYDSTDMVNTVGDTWSVAIGPYANGTEVDYHIEVTDNDGLDGGAPETGDYDLYVGMVTIQTIQSTMSPADTSAYEGSPRNVAGIVTVEPGMLADNIFFIQNHWVTSPAYRGIQVFSGGSLVGQLELGDSVAVCGDVDEYYAATQIRMHFTEAYTSYGNVGELPAYELSTSILPPDSTGTIPTSEPWESVLVMAKNSVVTNTSIGYGMWYIDNTDPRTGLETLVDDSSYYDFEPTTGDSLSVRGIVVFEYGEYKIEPRNDSDILPYDPNDAVGVTLGAGEPLSFALYQNVPNPFQGASTRIVFSLPQAEDAQLRVFDVQGRLVRTLVNGRVNAGRHMIDWNGRNDLNREVASGVYFYRLSAGEKEATRKLVFLK